MSRPLSVTATLLGFTGVALGAFGAHGLQGLVSGEMLEVWKTAVSYQLYHVPIILMLAFLSPFRERRAARIAAWCFVAGIVIFSGSLYVLVALDLPWLGMVTPVGGTLLLAGWLALTAAIVGKN